MLNDPAFDALADQLADLAKARNAKTAVIVMVEADGTELARGVGCTCDACFGAVIHSVAGGFAAKNDSDAEPAEAVH